MSSLKVKCPYCKRVLVNRLVDRCLYCDRVLGLAITLAVVAVILYWRKWEWLATPWPYVAVAAGWVPWLARMWKWFWVARRIARNVRVLKPHVASLRRLLMQFPKRDVDMTHPQIWVDRNRCILCGRCVRASRDLDGKHVFEFVGRGAEKRVAVNAEANLGDTDADVTDRAIEICPVGALMRKRVGYAVPVGERKYDHQPIGSDIEQAAKKE